MYEHRDLPNKWFDVVDVDPYGSVNFWMLLFKLVGD